jgi:hypothetical protein
LQPLAVDFAGLEAGDVCARPAQASDDACAERVAGAGEDDRNGSGRGLARLFGIDSSYFLKCDSSFPSMIRFDERFDRARFKSGP